MNEDEHYCPECGRIDSLCKCDWPMPTRPNAEVDLASSLSDIDKVMYQEMLNAVGYTLAFAACDAAWRAIIRSGYTVVPVRALVRTRNDA